MHLEIRSGALTRFSVNCFAPLCSKMPPQPRTIKTHWARKAPRPPWSYGAQAHYVLWSPDPSGPMSQTNPPRSKGHTKNGLQWALMTCGAHKTPMRTTKPARDGTQWVLGQAFEIVAGPRAGRSWKSWRIFGRVGPRGRDGPNMGWEGLGWAGPGRAG